MKKTRLLIDTDCGSDDAVALVMALRDPKIDVVAFTIPSGNCEMNQATENCLQSILYANTYKPPVYKGTSLPLWADYENAEQVHGIDGMGDCDWLRKPTDKADSENALDAMLRIIDSGEGDIEILAIGPLTNVAAAMLLRPDIMKKVPRITIMGGAHPYNNPHTTSAEFNIMCDPEAAKIVFEFGIPVVLAALEACWYDMRFSEEDIAHFKAVNELGAFCMDINRTIIDLSRELHGGVGSMDLPDAAAFACITRPDLIETGFDAYTQIETKGSYTRGATIFETEAHHYGKDFTPNSFVVTRMNGIGFKKYLEELITVGNGLDRSVFTD